MVDLLDLEGEEGAALRLLDDECLDVLGGLGRGHKREGQAVPSKSQNLRDKRIQLVDPLLEFGRVDGASEVDRFHGVSSVRLLTVEVEVNFKSREVARERPTDHRRTRRGTGLPTSTLRYYDRIGLIPATGRSGGQRRYDPKVIQRVRAVTLCQRSGSSLEETRRLLDGGRPWQALARRKVEELQGRKAELEQTTALLRSALECGSRSLENCGRAAHLAALAGPAGPVQAFRTVTGVAPQSA